MDLNNQKLLRMEGQKNIGVAHDRISELPDSLLHCILSFVETSCAARTSVLSKRWNHIWISIPNLHFRLWNLSEIPPFMHFMDRTLRLHEPSSIQKFYIRSYCDMDASWVHSLIENLTKHNVEELSLLLHGCDTLPVIPLSLFTRESLTKLEITVRPDFDLPKNISFPKLKILALWRVRFTDDCWNEKLFNNCQVLEELSLEKCTWFAMRNFSIVAPTLKVLRITAADEDEGLPDCDLRIGAPSLVSLTYWGILAKDYDLSHFPTLDTADVHFFTSRSRRESRISYCAALSKFLRELSHVKCLSVEVAAVQVHSVDDFVNCLPTFHNLNKLILHFGPMADKLIFALLKAAPHLKCLKFDKVVFLPGDGDKVCDNTGGDLCEHLQSVEFEGFNHKEMGWAEFILKNAKSLQAMTITYDARRYSNAKSKEVLMLELTNFPRASEMCLVKFVDNNELKTYEFIWL